MKSDVPSTIVDLSKFGYYNIIRAGQKCDEYKQILEKFGYKCSEHDGSERLEKICDANFEASFAYFNFAKISNKQKINEILQYLGKDERFAIPDHLCRIYKKENEVLVLIGEKKLTEFDIKEISESISEISLVSLLKTNIRTIEEFNISNALWPTKKYFNLDNKLYEKSNEKKLGKL